MSLADIVAIGATQAVGSLAGSASLAKPPTVISLRDMLAAPRACNIMFFGGQGTGKTRCALDILEMGYKVLYILADFGQSGTNTITNEFVARPDLHKYVDNFKMLAPMQPAEGQEIIAAKEWVKTLANFLRNPASIIADIFDFDPDFLFLDGYSSYQMCDLEASLLPEGEEFTRTDSENYSTWRSDRNGTLFPLMRFLTLNNRRTGKAWHKVVTLLDDEKGKKVAKETKWGKKEWETVAGTERIGPMLNTSARGLASAGFDIALMTVKTNFSPPTYEYHHQTATLLTKDRNFGLPDIIKAASFTKLWREYLEPRLKPITVSAESAKKSPKTP